MNNKGEWYVCDGYLDPAKDFKEPKQFARRIVTWKGTCESCNREYEVTMRIWQME